MGTINYTIVSGDLPITVSLVGSGLPDNIHNNYGQYSFTGVSSGEYILKTVDVSLNEKDIVVTPVLYNDLFPAPTIIVNQEENTFIEGTLITVEEIDTISKTIKLSYLPPYDTICNPISGKNWIVSKGVGTEPSLFGQDQAYLVITGGDNLTRVLNYSLTRYEEDFIVGTNIQLQNIFNNGWDFNFGLSSPLISAVGGTYYSTQCGPGDVWKHSDGTYRMALNGYNGTHWQVGLFTSPDLINWTSVSSVAKLTYLAGTWREKGIHVTHMIKHPTIPDRLFAICYGDDNSGFYRIGYVIFDEDMNNITYSTTDILDTTGTYTGLYEGSIYFYACEYRIITAARMSADVNATPWQLWEYRSDNVDGPYTFSRVVLDTTSSTIRDLHTCNRSSHSTETYMFEINGELYSMMCGTSRWNDSGNRGERQFGVIHFNRFKDIWEDDTRGVLMSGFQFADSVWGLPKGHTGGSPAVFRDGTDYYYFFSITQVTNQYAVVCSHKNIPYSTTTTTTTP